MRLTLGVSIDERLTESLFKAAGTRQRLQLLRTRFARGVPDRFDCLDRRHVRVARTFAFRESWTETLTRKAGHVASQELAYDDDVRRIRHMGGSPGDAAERAVFQGDVTALLAHVSHNLDTSENALGGARNLWEAWSGHREGPSFERDPGIPRE